MSGGWFLVEADQPSYEIIERIGGGGFGQVFKVVRNNTIVACKQVQTDDPRLALAEHKHMTLVKGGPCIAAIHEEVEWNEKTNILSFFMDFYKGGDLENVVHMLRAVGQRMAETHILDIAYQIAEALEYCHSKNLLHQDMKPMNVLLQTPWNPLTARTGPDIVVSDFGMSSHSHTIGSRITDQRGTPAYEAPEIRSQGRIAVFSQKSDIYAFGCILYRLCTLDDPDQAAGLKPLDISRDYSMDILCLISTMLSVDRLDRPTATQVKERLLALISNYIGENEKFNCRKCGQIYSSRDKLRRHLKRSRHNQDDGTQKSNGDGSHIFDGPAGPRIWVDEQAQHNSNEIGDRIPNEDTARRNTKPSVCVVCARLFESKEDFLEHLKLEPRHRKHPKWIIKRCLQEKASVVASQRKIVPTSSMPSKRNRASKRKIVSQRERV